MSNQEINNEEIIAIENLYSVYNEKTPEEYIALNNINYKFLKNKIYCIIGNSGSGKSTLVSYFNGLSISKYGKVKTKVSNIGHNWNFESTKIFPLEQKYNNTNFDELVVFNTNKLNPNIAKILISGRYKIKIDTIKRIKNISGIRDDFIIFGLKLNKNNKCEIIERYSKDAISNYSELANVVYPTYRQKKSFKKIKNYKELRKEIGMVFQFPEYQLFKDTIEKDIMFGPIALGVKKDEAKIRAKKFLNKLGMGDEYLNRNPFGLSGGQKRRVAIAGILAIDTNVLIFDEPTAGLDPVGEREMLDIIENAKSEGKTVFVITHTMDHVLEIADEVIVMNDGEIIASGSAYDIFTNKEILENTSIDTPKVITTINNLIEKDVRFNKILESKPKNVQQLAECIVNILKEE